MKNGLLEESHYQQLSGRCGRCDCVHGTSPTTESFFIYHPTKHQIIWNPCPVLGETLSSGCFRSKILLWSKVETHYLEVTFISVPDHHEVWDYYVFWLYFISCFIYTSHYCINTLFIIYFIFIFWATESWQMNRKPSAHARYTSAW